MVTGLAQSLWEPFPYCIGPPKRPGPYVILEIEQDPVTLTALWGMPVRVGSWAGQWSVLQGLRGFPLLGPLHRPPAWLKSPCALQCPTSTGSVRLDPVHEAHWVPGTHSLLTQVLCSLFPISGEQDHVPPRPHHPRSLILIP